MSATQKSPARIGIVKALILRRVTVQEGRMIANCSRLDADEPSAGAHTGDQRIGKAQFLSFLELDFIGELDEVVFHDLPPSLERGCRPPFYQVSTCWKSGR